MARSGRAVDWIAIGGVLAAGLTLWMRRFGVNDLIDGASNEVIFAREPLTTILFEMKWPDQSPLYFVLLHCWKVFGETPAAVRSLNVVFLSLSVAALYWIGRTCLESRAAAAVGSLLFAISPLSVYLVQSGRMYPEFLFFGLMGFFLLASGDHLGDRRRAAAFVACCVLGIYTHFGGFLMAAALFATWWIWILVSGRGRPGDSGAIPFERARLRTLVVAAGSVLVLSIPQIVRLVSLLANARSPGVLSIPGLSLEFHQRLLRFGFITTRDHSLTEHTLLVAVYLTAVLLLFVVGLLGARKLRVFLGVVAAAVILLGLLASHADIRDRHFVFVFPFVWIVVANGACGAVPAALRRGRLGPPPRVLRLAALWVVIFGSIGLSIVKTGEQYPQWTKLLSGLDRICPADTKVFMDPGPNRAVAVLAADTLNLGGPFQTILPLNDDAVERFESAIGKRTAVALLDHGRRQADAFRRIASRFERAGYHTTEVAVWGASGWLFSTVETTGTFVTAGPRVDTSADAIARLARRRLSDRAPDPTRPGFARTLAALVSTDGRFLESRFFLHQRGEGGSWKLGPTGWNSVDEVAVRTGLRRRCALSIPPVTGSIVAVAIPEVRLENELDIGWLGSRLSRHDGESRDVRVVVYAGDSRLAEWESSPSQSRQAERIDTGHLAGSQSDLVFLFVTSAADERPLTFTFATSSRLPWSG